MQRFTCLGIALTTLAGLAHAQSGDATETQNAALKPQSQFEPTTSPIAKGKSSGLDRFYAPIHSAAADVGGEYGLWASGNDYKVSFHDGMAFYSVLGDSYAKNLPLQWHTRAIRIGDKNLVTANGATKTHSEWRIELDYGSVIEAYDVEKKGVEQTFVLRQKPGMGDLVIEGTIKSELEASPFAAAHRDITFFDKHGTAIAGYGAATAVDADGHSMPMTTSFDGSTITLTLPGAWLAQASYPVTVDPLLTSKIIATHGTANPSRPDVARDDRANQLMTTYGRAVSASDYDGYGRITDDDFTNTALVYSDLSASWSTRNLDCAFVGGAAKWIIVLQRKFTTGHAIRYHVHNSNDKAYSSSYKALAYKSGDSHTFPDVGGTDSFSTGRNAIVVWQEDKNSLTGASKNSEAWGVLVNLSTQTSGTKFLLSTGGGVTAGSNDFDRERPAVTQISDGGTSSWLVCYQQFNHKITNDDWDIIIGRKEYNGTSGGSNFVGNASSKVHSINPKVAGRGGRFMVLYGELSNTGKTSTGWAPTIKAHRFDWSETSQTPTKKDLKTVRSSRTTRFWNGDIAFDHNTDSHFCAVYHSQKWDIYVSRLGYNAGVAESVIAYSGAASSFSPGVTFNDDANEFPFVYATTEANDPVYGQILTYKAATDSIYGSGCGGTISASGTNRGIPHAGHEFYTVNLSGAAANAPAALWISLGSANIPLAAAGAPGCFLNIDPNLLIVGLGFTTSATGRGSFEIPLPAPVAGNIYFQYGYVSPGANALGFLGTRGLKAEIR